MAGARSRSVLIVALVVAVAGCSWGMAGHGPERSGFSRFETSITRANVATLAEAWRSATANVTSAPVVGDGKVFASGGPTATTADNSLVAFDLTGGDGCEVAIPRRCQPVWSVAFPPRVIAVREGPAVSPPSFDAGSVYIGLTHSSQMFGQYTETDVFDADTGAPRPGPPLSHGGRVSAAVGNGLLAASVTSVVKASPGPLMFDTLAVFDTATGDERFAAATGYDTNFHQPVVATFSAPAVADNVVYALASDRLLAYDAHGVTGCIGRDPFLLDPICLPLWSAPLTGHGAWDAMPTVANGLVYVPELNGHVQVFSATGCGVKTCHRLWSAIAGGSHLAPVAVTDSTLFVGSDDGKISAFPAAGCGRTSCAPSWTADLAAGVGSPTVAGDFAFVGTSGGTLAAFDATGCGHPTCAPLWSANVGAAVRGAPVVADGRVLVTGADGVLRAFALGDRR